MTAESRPPFPARVMSLLGGVRVRTTLVAVIAVAVALAVAGTALVVLLRRSLEADARSAANFRAEAIADLAAEGSVDGPIHITDAEDEFVQVLGDDGNVVASSENVAGSGPLVPRGAGETERVEVPFEDERFLAVRSTTTTPDGPVTVVAGHTLENAVESTEVVVNLLLFGLPLLLFVVAIVTWNTVGGALRPVEDLRTRVQAISSERLEDRVPVPATEDEIARLATTMNEMLRRLEEAQQRQRRFVSDASHELRSPVASIRQQVEVALAHPGSLSADELARTIHEENLRVEHLVDDLLILARIDEGTQFTPAEVDLDDIVFDEVRRVSKINDRTIDSTRVSGGRVRGDRKQLRRMVGNLLENAARHARRGVAVDLGENDGRVVLDVDDDGGGIAPADRERVFERFVRLSSARERDLGGAGLGLAIVAEVARAHGGGVTILDSPTGGARFRVELPRA